MGKDGRSSICMSESLDSCKAFGSFIDYELISSFRNKLNNKS